MADVGLHRADSAVAAAARAEAKCVGERGHLDRVSQARAGAVGLDVADGVRRDAGHALRARDHRGLRLRVRRGEADLIETVVVDGRAADHCAHVVAVGQCVAQSAQHHEAGPAAEQRAVAGCVEWAAAPARREHRAFHRQVASVVGQVDRRAADQRDVAVVGQ